MNKDKLTPEIVVEYHTAMCAEVNAMLLTLENVQGVLDLLDKGSPIENVTTPVRQILDLLDFLDALGVPNPATFLRTTAVTVPAPSGRILIYVPWTLGQGDLTQQCETLAHECQHAVQARLDPEWLRQYVESFSYRGRSEKSAFLAGLEVRFWLYGIVPNAKDYVGDLSRYFLRPTDEEVLTTSLQRCIPPVLEGARATSSGKFAVKWLDDRTTQ